MGGELRLQEQGGIREQFLYAGGSLSYMKSQFSSIIKIAIYNAAYIWTLSKTMRA